MTGADDRAEPARHPDWRNAMVEFDPDWPAPAGAALDEPIVEPVVEPVVEPPVDLVNHPPHYTEHPSGVECITITQHMGFCLGNAVKYIWRADLKGSAVEDLRKAVWYIEREIARRGGAL